MSLRKSPTMTPARLEANRRSAQKSTGPRTAQGKTHSRLNSLRTGRHSPLLRDFRLALLHALEARSSKQGRRSCPPNNPHTRCIAK